MLAEAHRVPERGGQWGDEVFVTVLRSLCACNHDMQPVRAKEECSDACVRAVAWGEPLMPYSVQAWEVEVVCAGTGAAGTSAAVWAVRTHVSGTSPKLARLWAAVSVTPAAHQHINGI